MELRQLRYFIRIVELGSMGRAALDLGVGTPALSQQISRLEGELSTRLLQRTATGVLPTDAGLAFFRQAQLAIRHADAAAQAARQARLAGHVSIGLAPSTSGVLALPLLEAMRERYPDVRLRVVESLSGNLATMLNARQLDLAVLFETDGARRWSVLPLLDERLFVIGRRDLPGMPTGRSVRIARLASFAAGSAQRHARAARDPRCRLRTRALYTPRRARDRRPGDADGRGAGRAGRHHPAGRGDRAAGRRAPGAGAHR